MADFHAAWQTIASALKTGQIGTPVAVRLVLHPAADHGPIERLTAQALEAATTWLDAEPEQLFAAGSAEIGQISVLARCAGGRSALVSAGSSGLGTPLAEIVVFGNRGILSWEGGLAASTDEAHRDQRPKSKRTEKLLADLREALSRAKQGDPVPHSRADAQPKPVQRTTPVAPPYGVLLVAGDFTHQSNYAPLFAADKRCRLIALTDELDVTPRRRRLNEQLAMSLGIPYLPDLKPALARPDVQIVSICAEPMRRGRIIVQAAQAGKHVYLDKPLAGSLPDADAIVAAIRQAGVANHMFSLVHSELADRVRAEIASRRLGDLTAFHFDLCFAKGQAGTSQLDQPRRETLIPEEFELPDSKRELTNIGVYPVVLLLTLLGREVRSVAATTGNYFFAENQRNNMEDFGQMLLRLDGGIAATVSAGRTGWRSHPAGGLSRAVLVGTKGTAVIDAHRPRLEVWADVTPWTAPTRDPEDPMGMWRAPTPGPHAARPKESWITPADPASARDAAHFLDCLEQGRESSVPARLAAAATEILLAAYRSAATLRDVQLPLPR